MDSSADTPKRGGPPPPTSSSSSSSPLDFKNGLDSKALIVKRRVEPESMDFEETESESWRKHQFKRFALEKGTFWTSSRSATFYKWFLVVLIGVTIGVLGIIVYELTKVLSDAKFDTVSRFMSRGQQGRAYFIFLGFCLLYAFIAGGFCWIEPFAVGSGIPDVKAYLNGVNLNKIVRVRVLVCKIIGMCFSCSASLPIGKEGPMIHCGAIVGAAFSQGRTSFFGFDTSWTKYQDLRNDRSKRDFVTFGAAAGVAAAFSAPIGGILFTLEEGASFWSTTLTFRAFFCAMVTQLVFTLISVKDGVLGTTNDNGVFAFGQFYNYPFYVYELIIFLLMGIGGGIIGALFNHINMRVTYFRNQYSGDKSKRMLEVLILTFAFATTAFVFPLMWNKCTDIPTQTADWQPIERDLVDKLVQFQCGENQYNQVASLYVTDPDVAIEQLFHFREYNGTSYETFSTGALLMFLIPYFLFAAVVSGTFAPAGLFVPTLLSGAAYGRIIGHLLNCAFPGKVTNAGIYALIGAASILGGMSRMTIAGTVIMLEACGSPQMLLPLMLTFFAARYTGNTINEGMYDLQINIKHLPFLESSLKTLGLLNYCPVHEVMKSPVVCIYEISKVSTIYNILKGCSHNGFPVINKENQLRGFILRKHLCQLLFNKSFSSISKGDVGAPVTSLAYDSLEKDYPHYPKFEELEHITAEDMSQVFDVRSYMDTATYSINESASVGKCYRFFRTMGLRHLVVLDDKFRVTGIITRHDIHEHRLEHHWFDAGDDIQKFLNVGPSDNKTILDDYGVNSGSEQHQTSVFSATAQSADEFLTSSSISADSSNDSSRPSSTRGGGRGVKEPKMTKDRS